MELSDKRGESNDDGVAVAQTTQLLPQLPRREKHLKEFNHCDNHQSKVPQQQQQKQQRDQTVDKCKDENDGEDTDNQERCNIFEEEASNPNTDQCEEGEVTNPNIDQGWGYCVAVAGFFVAFMLDGMENSYGVLLPYLIEGLGSGVAMTSFAGGLLTGVCLMTGPVSAKLVERFGCRPVAFIGGLVASIGVVISTFSVNIQMFIMFYGVMAGLGIGLLYLPSITIINMYFQKKRGLVLGIVTSGSGAGLLVMSLLIEYLVNEYGWRGAYLIIAGLYLHLCFCACIMRPVTPDPTPNDTLLFPNAEEEKKTSSSSSSSTTTTNKKEKPDNKTEIYNETTLTLGDQSNTPLLSITDENGKREKYDVLKFSKNNPISNNDGIITKLLRNELELESNDCGFEISNVKEIDKNDNIGEIDKNDNIGEIDKNDNIGEIDKNDNIGEIDKNDNIGEIDKKDMIEQLKKSDNKGCVDNCICDDDSCCRVRGSLSSYEKMSKCPCQFYDESKTSNNATTHACREDKLLKQIKLKTENGARSSSSGKGEGRGGMNVYAFHSSHPGLISGLNVGGNGASDFGRRRSNSVNCNYNNTPYDGRGLDDQTKQRQTNTNGGINHHPHHRLQHQDIKITPRFRSVDGFSGSSLSRLFMNIPSECISLSTTSLAVQSSSQTIKRHDSGGHGSVLGSKIDVVTPDHATQDDLDPSPLTTHRHHSALSLLKDPILVMFCLSALFIQLASSIPPMFSPSYARSLGLDSMQAAKLVSILGITNTIGRLLTGVLSYVGTNNLLLYTAGTTIAGLSCFAIPLCTSYGSLIAFAAGHGFFIGVFPPLQSVILVELLGLERLPSSFGIMCFSKSIASMAGPSIAGGLYQWFKDFTVPFLFAGVIISLANVLHCVIAVCRRKSPVPADVPLQEMSSS